MGVDRKITVHDWAYVLNESEHAHDIDSTKFNGVSLRQELVRLYAVESELAASRQRVSELEAEAVHHRAEWAQAMSDIVRLREALRQWQLGIGDTEAERKIAELQTTLASREAALREIRDRSLDAVLSGFETKTLFSAQFCLDRAAQEVGRNG